MITWSVGQSIYLTHYLTISMHCDASCRDDQSTNNLYFTLRSGPTSVKIISSQTSASRQLHGTTRLSSACTQASAARWRALPLSACLAANASLARVRLAGRDRRIDARRRIAPVDSHGAYHARRRPVWPVKHVRRRMEVVHLWVSLHHGRGGWRVHKARRRLWRAQPASPRACALDLFVQGLVQHVPMKMRR